MSITHWSTEPAPVQSEWQGPKYPNQAKGQYKELLALFPSLTHRHCGMFMRRVLRFHRYNASAPAQRVSYKAWLCPVCDIRQYPDPGL